MGSFVFFNHKGLAA